MSFADPQMIPVEVNPDPSVGVRKSTTIDISIVIVTWNAKRYTEECLRSLEQQRADLAMEIIVVDNASSDGTVELVRDEFPRVNLVENPGNYGFARGNNIGLRRARGQYVCLINSDVNVPPECLPRMHEYMEATPAIGVLGPRMLGRRGTVDRSYMRFPTIWNCLCNTLALDSLFGGSRLFGGILMRDFKNTRTADVEVLNGWFLMIRRAALEQVGLLDETFFMYGEDIDWSYRFYKAGWKRVYFAGAEAIHYGGASSDNAPVRFYIEKQRANLQFWRKHHGRLGAASYRLVVYLHESLRLLGHGVRFLVKGSARAEAALKVKRSWACIRTLSGAGSRGEATA